LKIKQRILLLIVINNEYLLSTLFQILQKTTFTYTYYFYQNCLIMTRHCYYVFLLLFLTACQPENTDPDVNIDISDELQIELWEVLDASQRMLELHVMTLEDLDCENYSISFSMNQLGNSTVISINNILPPHECDPGVAPASNQIEMGYFPEGEYPIQLNLKNNEIINLGQLNVRPRFYELTMESDYGIYLPWDILKTVPDDLIWGSINMEDAADENLILEEFDNKLGPWTEDIGLSQGEYGYFKIENGTASSIKDQRETITENIFLLKQTGTQEELKTALDDLRSKFPNQISIKAFLSDGSFL